MNISTHPATNCVGKHKEPLYHLRVRESVSKVERLSLVLRMKQSMYMRLCETQDVASQTVVQIWTNHGGKSSRLRTNYQAK